MTVDEVVQDDRFVLDEPELRPVISEAILLGWTNDPFDRLLAANARFRKWRLATSDGNLLGQLKPTEVLALVAA